MLKRTLLLSALLAQLLSPVGLKYVIFKLDDIGGKPGFGYWNSVATTLISNQIHASFGVIGEQAELYGDSFGFWPWFSNALTNHIQFWDHTYSHTDCTVLDAAGQWWQHARNLNLIRRKTGTTLSGYGAPGNTLNGDTVGVVDGLDDCDFWFFGKSNTLKKNLLRLGEMEFPTLVPNYTNFLTNWVKALTNASNAGADYLVLQGHPGSWNLDRWTNFQAILGFLTNQGLSFVTPSEYIEIKTAGMGISNLAPETVFAPGDTVSGQVTGSNAAWSVDLLEGTNLQNLASGSGASFSASLPAVCKITNRVRVTVRSQGFTHCQTHSIVPIGSNDLASSATPTATSQTAGFEAAKALDRSLASAWRPSGALPQSLTLDFGATKILASAYLAWKPNLHADLWQLYGSLDGSSWFVVASNDIGGGGGEFVRLAPSNARYLRLTASRSINPNGAVELAECFAFELLSAYTNLSPSLILAEADASIRSANPNSNFGTNTYLEVQNTTGPLALVRFDLGTNQAASLARAKLYLYPVAGGTGASTTNIAKWVADNTWDETNVTWNLRPALGSTFGTADPFGFRVEFDVTPAVTNAMASGGKVSFAVCGTNSAYVRYTSREEPGYGGTRGPTLELSYERGVISPATNTNLTGPTASFTRAPSGSFAVGTPVVFSNLSTAGSAAITNWSWDFGNGAASNWASNLGLTAAVYTNSGNFTARLTVLDANGLSNTVTVGPFSATNLAVAPTNAVPEAPTNLVAAELSSASVRLSWSHPAPAAARFNVYRSLDATNFLPLATAASNVLEFQDSGLVPFTRYTYRVTATNDIGESAPCAVAAITPARRATLTRAVATVDALQNRVAITVRLEKNCPEAAALSFRLASASTGSWIDLGAGDVEGAVSIGAGKGAEAASNAWRVPTGFDVSRKVDLMVCASLPGTNAAAVIVSNVDLGLLFRLCGDLALACAVNSPWRGQSEGITFVNLTRETTARIYSVSGSLVAELKTTDAGAGDRLTWKLASGEKTVTPGIYLAVLRSGEKDLKRLKVMVCRP